MVSSAARISLAGHRHCPACLALSRHRWEQPRTTHGLGARGRRAGCITCGKGRLSLTALPVPSTTDTTPCCRGPDAAQLGAEWWGRDAPRGPETLDRKDCCPKTTRMGVQLPVTLHLEDGGAMQGGTPSRAGTAGFRAPAGRYLETVGLPVSLKKHGSVLATGLVHLLHGPCLPLRPVELPLAHHRCEGALDPAQLQDLAERL